jgi:hypothetical protein
MNEKEAKKVIGSLWSKLSSEKEILSKEII